MRVVRIQLVSSRRNGSTGSQPAWAPHGTRFAIDTSDEVLVFDARQPGTPVLRLPRAARTLSWSPSSDRLVLSFDDDDRLLAIGADGSRVWEASLGEPASDVLVWSPDGRLLATVNDTVVVCDASAGTALWQASRTADVVHTHVHTAIGVEGASFGTRGLAPSQACWSPDGARLAVAWEDMVAVHRAADGSAEVTRPPLARGKERLFWEAPGELLAELDGQRLARCALAVEDRWLQHVVFSEDGRRAAGEGTEHVLHVQDEHGARRYAGHPRTIEGLAWSSRGVLATICRDGLLRTWSAAQDGVEVLAELGSHFGAMAWSADGTQLLVWHQEQLHLVDVA